MVYICSIENERLTNSLKEQAATAQYGKNYYENLHNITRSKFYC